MTCFGIPGMAIPRVSRGHAAQRVYRWTGIILAAALVGACASSPPMRYYTLTQLAPEKALSVPPDTTPIQLSRLSIPGELDRLQLVRRIDATRLQIAENDRWAAPLDEMIRRVLSGDLAARLSPDLVIDPNEGQAGERRRTLSVDFQELYADTGCAVMLRATWVLTPAPSQNVQRNAKSDAEQADRTPQPTQVSEEVQVPGGGCSGPDAVPGAMSRALALLSDRIATRVTRSETARGP